MKSFVSIVCLLVVAALCAEARPKRSVYVAAPVVAASVPVVHSAAVVHSNPTTVVKTEQVHGGGHSSYSYSTEVKANPIVQHTVHSAPVVASAVHTYPAAAYYSHGYYPSYSYPSYATYSAAYSPYHYVVGK